jgi:hypothetical protein
MPVDTITGSRQSTFRVTLTVDGQDMGVWETKNGGATSGNTTQIKPGAMSPPKSLGGTPTTDTITLTRNYDRVRDHPNRGFMLARVGKGLCVVREQPLDNDGNAYGQPIVTNGTLDKYTPPDIDAGSDNSAEVSLDIVPNGNPSA